MNDAILRHLIAFGLRYILAPKHQGCDRRGLVGRKLLCQTSHVNGTSLPPRGENLIKDLPPFRTENSLQLRLSLKTADCAGEAKHKGNQGRLCHVLRHLPPRLALQRTPARTLNPKVLSRRPAKELLSDPQEICGPAAQ